MEKLTIFKNKGETLKCQVSVEGAAVKDTVVRLCLEFDDNTNLFFYGKLQEDGDCIIEIPRLKNIEEKEGRAIIEAIADSLYFKLYESDVEIKNSVEITMNKTPREIKTQPKTKVQLESLTKAADVVKEQPVPEEPPVVQEPKAASNALLQSFEEYARKKSIPTPKRR